jgi:colicin import membrane protein
MTEDKDDKEVTSEEASALREEVAEVSEERDDAVEAAIQAKGKEAEAREDAKEQHAEALSAQASAIRASGREAVAREDAREQHAEALSAQASATRASGREAIAKEDASEQHAEALSAQADAANMNTLRHVSNVRADGEARAGNRARFALYVLTTGILVVLVVVVAWFSTR